MFPANEWYMHKSVSDGQVAVKLKPSFAFLCLPSPSNVGSRLGSAPSSISWLFHCLLWLGRKLQAGPLQGWLQCRKELQYSGPYARWTTLRFAALVITRIKICPGLPMTLLMSESKSLFRTVDPLAPCVLQNLAISKILWRVGIESDYGQI